MVQTKKNEHFLEKIAMLFMTVYIFMSYNACDLWISSTWNSLSLYAFLGVGALFAFTKLLKNTKTKIPTPFLWYMLFLTFSMVITIYSEERGILSGTYYRMIIAFILSALFFITITDPKRFSLFCWAFSVSASFLVLTLQLTDNLVGVENDRLGEDLMGNANTFALMMMVAALLTLWLLVYGKSKWPAKILLVVCLLADMYALSLSAGRKFFIVPFFFLYLLLLFRTDKKGRKHFLWYTALIAVLVWIVYYLIMNVPTFYDAIGKRMEMLFAGITGEGKVDGSAALRERMRDLAISEWLKSPIFGYGFDSFKFLGQRELRFYSYSHCNFTELLYNGGIFYLVLYYSMYFVILKKALIEKRGSLPFRAFAVATTLSFLIFDYGAVTYESNYIITPLFLAYACLKFEEKEEEKVSP